MSAFTSTHNLRAAPSGPGHLLNWLACALLQLRDAIVNLPATVPQLCRPGHALLRLPTVCMAILLLSLAGCGGDGVGNSASGTPPVIDVQPTSQSGISGSNVVLSVTAHGDIITYQWQTSTNLGTTWTDVAGATAATYTLSGLTSAMNGWQFRVTITSDGSSVESSAITITVTAATAPSISLQPADIQAVTGADAAFSVTAGGTALSYQWQISTDGNTWTNVSGANSATYSLGTVALGDSGHRFRVVVSNSESSVTSNPAVLTVTPASQSPVITTQPLAVGVQAGQTATFSVVATGNPAPTYQWEISTDGLTFNDIASATSASYTTPATATTDSGKQYRVRVSNSIGSATSNPAALTVTAAQTAPVVTSQPLSQSVVAPATATFTVAASGSPTPTYQWQVSTNGGATFANINGATSTSYTTPATAAGDNGKQFRAVVGNSVGSVSSIAATLTVGTSTLGGYPYAVSVGSGNNIIVIVLPNIYTTTNQFAGIVQSVSSSSGVSTLAGNSTQGFVNATGTVAEFNGPQGIAQDNAGNAYVADGNNVIRKVTPAGVVSTFAGSGAVGSADGQGAAATFFAPVGAAIDSSGNLYIADRNNHAVRKITPSGLVSTLAGCVFATPQGVAVDTAGNVYVSDSNSNFICKISTSSGTATSLAGGAYGFADGTGSAASFEAPAGLAVDSSGNVYVADSNNSAIRKVTPAGVVTTLAGNGTAGFLDGTGNSAIFNTPLGVALDAIGNVFVADTGNHAIRKVTVGGAVTTLVH